MQNKKIILSVVVCVVIAGISFWGGMKYGQSKSKNIATSFNRQLQGGQGNFAGRTGGQQGIRNGGAVGGGLVSGEILSKDDKSMTVKLSNGGSKIVLISPSTTVEKTVSGATADVVVGGQVMVTGQANPDGSVNATSIQLRPTIATPTK